ncbi:MAG: SEC-C domain-containing protein [Acidobacteria bacterium]|nr:SEC-C domain-containing protein [Acidobacteriota bacterium]
MKRAKSLPPVAKGTEWVGGRTTFPDEVMFEGEQPEVIVWYELPSGFILGLTAIDIEHPLSFSQSFHDAVWSPGKGEPRSPETIRVATEELADTLRAIGAAKKIVVAPTPEVDRVVAELAAAISRDPEPLDWSYFGDGSIPLPVVVEFFETALAFARKKPWKVIQPHQILGFDSEQLDAQESLLSVGGAAGAPAIFVFDSIEAFALFSSDDEVFEQGDQECDPAEPPGMLLMSLQPRRNVPPPLLEELDQFGWPVARGKIPVVSAYDMAGHEVTLSERELRIVSLAMAGAIDLAGRHARLFREPDPDRVEVRRTDSAGFTAKITAPFEPPEDFDEEQDDDDDALIDHPSGLLTRSSGPRRVPEPVGRNEPCPCGSGKKYKKCHLGAPPPARRPRLQNTDGDPILFITDAFWFDPADRDEVIRRIGEIEGAVPPVSEDGETRIVILRPDHPGNPDSDTTVIGTIFVRETAVLAEANSHKRADALRRWIEEACGETVHFTHRDENDALADIGILPPDPSGPVVGPDPAFLRAYKEKHYGTWADEPLPALGGRTPREAAATSNGRKQVDELLTIMEEMEATRPEEERFDFGRIRGELGL